MTNEIRQNRKMLVRSILSPCITRNARKMDRKKWCRKNNNDATWIWNERNQSNYKQIEKNAQNGANITTHTLTFKWRDETVAMMLTQVDAVAALAISTLHKWIGIRFGRINCERKCMYKCLMLDSTVRTVFVQRS